MVGSDKIEVKVRLGEKRREVRRPSDFQYLTHSLNIFTFSEKISLTFHWLCRTKYYPRLNLTSENRPVSKKAKRIHCNMKFAQNPIKPQRKLSFSYVFLSSFLAVRRRLQCRFTRSGARLPHVLIYINSLSLVLFERLTFDPLSMAPRSTLSWLVMTLACTHDPMRTKGTKRLPTRPIFHCR